MSYMDFSSWPRDQEQQFVVYEQYTSWRVFCSHGASIRRRVRRAYTTMVLLPQNPGDRRLVRGAVVRETIFARAGPPFSRDRLRSGRPFSA